MKNLESHIAEDLDKGGGKEFGHVFFLLGCVGKMKVGTRTCNELIINFDYVRNGGT